MSPGAQMEPGPGLSLTDLTLHLGPLLTCCEALGKSLALSEPWIPQHITWKASQTALHQCLVESTSERSMSLSRAHSSAPLEPLYSWGRGKV